jgi:ferrous iron transport protein B
MSESKKVKEFVVALVGNPNSGKTTLFNALTGLRHKIANYPGVTVEKKEGSLVLPGSRETVTVMDLPGAYSLLTRSPDEDVVHRVLFDAQEKSSAPDLLVIVADATNLERNLFFVTQLLEMGIPCIVALNMWDMVKKNSTDIDLDTLSKSLRVRIIPTVGSHKKGIRELIEAIESQLYGNFDSGSNYFKLKYPDAVEREISKIQTLIEPENPDLRAAYRGEALRLLGSGKNSLFEEKGASLQEALENGRKNLIQQGIDPSSVEAEERYAFIQKLCREVVHKPLNISRSLSEKVDFVLTHKIWGFIFFFALMVLMFQAIFSWASVPMDALSNLMDAAGQWIGKWMPEGQLKSLVMDGVVAGVGSVIVFLPQIVFLFFFIAIFEDSGYMARAAFVLDKVMRGVGLNGKSFIPLLSSFACAVPGIMSARTIEDKNDRLATIMVAPLMSCSARLPVYTLMISAFIPSKKILGVFNVQGLTLFAMYFLSIVTGLGMAAIFRKTLLKGNITPFVLELPPYRVPNFRTVFITLWEKGKLFLYRAGTIIFNLSIVLWFLASYPRHENIEHQYADMKTSAMESYSGTILDEKISEIENLKKSEQIKNSFAGQMGKAIEPIIRPLGFDWKMGIGLIASFAAREVLVSTLAIVYNVNEGDDSNVSLISRLQNEKSPDTGKSLYTPLTAVSLMVFFVLACQCMSTVAVVKKETNSWRWPIFMVLYMTALAWLGSFVVYQLGSLFFT